ncbi:hypothetical protein Tco_0591440 [Tanacetum coccineum]
MANLSFTSGTNGATTSQVNEVHIDANQIFGNVNHLLTHEMHQEEHMDSDVESDIDDNTIPYHQYNLTASFMMEQSLVNDSLRAELARCKQEMHFLHPTITSVKVHDSEDSLVHTEVSRSKMSKRLGTFKPINYAELNALYSHFVPQRELSQEQSQISTCLRGLNSWIPAFAHVIDQRTDPCRYPSGSGEFKPVKAMFTEQIIPFYENVKQLVQKLNENIVTEVTEYMRIFDELDTEYERCVLANKNLNIERKNLLIQNDCLIANSLEKDICSIVLASDIVVPPSSNCLCEELRSNCDREHSKVVELEAEILKKQQMLNESEKRFKGSASRERRHIRKLHIRSHTENVDVDQL